MSWLHLSRHYQHTPLPDLEQYLSVLQLVLDAAHGARQLAPLSDGHQRHSELERHQWAEQEAARVQRNHRLRARTQLEGPLHQHVPQRRERRRPQQRAENVPVNRQNGNIDMVFWNAILMIN